MLINKKFLQGPGACFTFFQKESLAAGGKSENELYFPFPFKLLQFFSLLHGSPTYFF